jgi:hypothetical protein
MKWFILIFANALFVTSGFAHGMSEEDKQRILDAGYWEYMLLGAKHMLTGYDHLLFLFGVIFFLNRFKDIFVFITAFTVGHCITLIAATLLGITANYYLIDAVIALTVIYKGFDNIDGFRKYLQVDPPALPGMVFGFGLIHGFGLSTRLQQLPLGEDGLGLVLRILSFNGGVEVGQVVALAVMFLLLTNWRKTDSFKKFGKAANVGLMFVGFMLFLMQLHGYQHALYSDEFPLNKDDHAHVHQEIRGTAGEHVATSEATPTELSPPPSPHDHGDGVMHPH